MMDKDSCVERSASSTQELFERWPLFNRQQPYEEHATRSRRKGLRKGSWRFHVRRRIWVLSACVLFLAACSDVSVVDSMTIVNETDYPAQTEVTGADRNGWLLLTHAQQRQTTALEEVIDQGETWVFRFGYLGKHQEEVEVSRRELEQDDWTIEVPLSFEQRLHALGVPVPPE